MRCITNNRLHLFQVSLNPIRVLKHDADEEKAETARLSSFVGAMAVGDLVKSTLGPKVRVLHKCICCESHPSL